MCSRRWFQNVSQKLDLFGETLFFYPVANTFSQTGCQIPCTFPIDYKQKTTNFQTCGLVLCYWLLYEKCYILAECQLNMSWTSIQMSGWTSTFHQLLLLNIYLSPKLSYVHCI